MGANVTMTGGVSWRCSLCGARVPMGYFHSCPSFPRRINEPAAPQPEDVFTRIAMALERLANAVEHPRREVSVSPEPDPED
jgi:hypothetical protein